VTFLAELTDKAALLNRLADPTARIITKPVKAEAIYDFLDLSVTRSSTAAVNKRIKPVAIIDKDTASVSCLSFCADTSELSDLTRSCLASSIGHFIRG
jgi:hypothetical protein